MKQMSEKLIESLKRTFFPGVRVECIQMEDPWHPIKPGTRGTVTSVDDVGTIHVRWDTGSGLGLVYGEDKFKIVYPEEEANDRRR